MLLNYLIASTLLFGTSDALIAGEELVKDFYSQLHIISVTPDGNEAFFAKSRCKKMCGVSAQFCFYPNEFKDFPVTNKSSETNIEIGAFLKMFTEVSLNDFSFNSRYVQSLSTYAKPEFIKGELPDDFASYVVEKEYVKNNVNVRLVDTVIVNLANRQILGIRNRMGGYSCSIPKEENGNEEETRKEEKNSIIGLMERAQRMYAIKHYYDAYNIFREILEIDENNPEANYYLALMSYRREGCRQLSKKVTDKLAYKYICKAYEYSSGELRRCAYRVLDNFTDPIVI